MSDFGKIVKAVRQKRNLTQKQLALDTGTSERTIQTYEGNVKKPSYDILIALADSLGVSIDYLCGRTDNPDLNNTKPIKKSSVYVTDEDRELVMTCLALDNADKSILLGAAKAALSNEKYSQKLTKNLAGL